VPEPSFPARLTNGRYRGSGSSSPARVSMARAISSWLSGGNLRTASRVFSISLVMGREYASPAEPRKGVFVKADHPAFSRKRRKAVM
jgi:hypothetical protein